MCFVLGSSLVLMAIRAMIADDADEVSFIFPSKFDVTQIH
jgi:hypothetical protein